jgi:hypothetical protein
MAGGIAATVSTTPESQRGRQRQIALRQLVDGARRGADYNNVELQARVMAF